MNRTHDYQPPIVWTPYLDAKLTDARIVRRLGWKAVARVMGFAERTCQRRGRQLGIGAPLRRLGAYTPAVEAEIARRRNAGEPYRLIAASLGLCHTDVWRHYQDAISSAPASRVASEVRQAPDGRAAAFSSAVSVTLDVSPPQTRPVASWQRGAFLPGASK